ncbi:MAG: outer membrane protein transport protein [candidate division Zixibacteria bacterium]|nr:outer membrane protein transport protein [candidate division Zixibacteria bacterium]
MGILRYFGFLFLLLLLLLPSAFGGGFTYDGIGVKARGMGGAFRAIADDWSAAYYNPAGYARIKDNVIAGNVAFFHNRYWAKPHIKWGDQYETGYFDGQDIANGHEVLNVPQAGILARFPVWGEAVMGFSIIQTFDQNQNWQLYKNIPAYNKMNFPRLQYYNNLDVVAFQITAAREFLDKKLSGGIGLALLRGDLVFNNVVLRNSPMSAPISDRPFDKIPEWYHNNLNGWGFGYRAGIIYHLNDAMDLAATYVGKSSFDLSGAADFKFYMGDKASIYSPASEEYFFQKGGVKDVAADVKTTLDLPASISGAISYKANKDLVLALDVELVFWSEFRGFDFRYSNYKGLKSANPTTNFANANELFTTSPSARVDWKDAGRLMLGADYKPFSFLDLRSGVSWDQSPIKDSTFIPQFMDLGDKFSYSFGFGFAIGFWNLDLATTYTHQPDRDIKDMNIQDGLLVNLPANYRANNYQTVLGISYRF